MEREKSIATKIQPLTEGVYKHPYGINRRNQRACCKKLPLHLGCIATGCDTDRSTQSVIKEAKTREQEPTAIRTHHDNGVRLVGIGTVKMTVGVRRRTQEKVQYCITAIDNK